MAAPSHPPVPRLRAGGPHTATNANKGGKPPLPHPTPPQAPARALSHCPRPSGVKGRALYAAKARACALALDPWFHAVRCPRARTRRKRTRERSPKNMLILPTNRCQLLCYVLALDVALKDPNLPPQRRQLLRRYYRVLDAMAVTGAFSGQPPPACGGSARPPARTAWSPRGGPRRGSARQPPCPGPRCAETPRPRRFSGRCA